MLFHTGDFLLFFFVFFHVYWMLHRYKMPLWSIQGLILGGSYFFYSYWDFRLLGLIVFSSLVDYFCGRQIMRSQQERNRKRYVYLSIFVNIGLLAVFKYFNFFGESLAEIFRLFGTEMSWTTKNIVLPVGISFYTFQSLSYTIDVYRRKIKAEENLLVFLSYVSFFPQLVAGPIERAGHLMPQFHQRLTLRNELVISGLRLVLYGLFQKLVIADNLGLLVQELLQTENLSGQSLEADFNVASILLISIAFSIQIFADFAGYSNIAIGVARLLGFDLRPNFKAPYTANSLREFWQRWHISLSQWFRDYVYIPLGGNRRGVLRNDLNIFLTFLLSGLWHGAAWTFVTWGLLHGSLLVIERHLPKVKISRLLKTTFIFILVSLCWLPFRAENWEQLQSIVMGLGNWSNWSLPMITALSVVELVILGFSLLILTSIDLRLRNKDFAVLIGQGPVALRWTTYFTLLILLLMMVPLDSAPTFIYFQF